ncbi:hypothetical protein AgCh_001601 [Apium graveolens]
MSCLELTEAITLCLYHQPKSRIDFVFEPRKRRGFLARLGNQSSMSNTKMDVKVKNLIEIVEDDCPIDMSKYINYVQSPSCGAIATFSGTTRDTFQGKEVLELRYEAYVPMAVRCLESICSSARSLWSLNSIAVAHRLGSVPVGEISVFVAISSVHRSDALDACKFIIDEIKATVPIWKKEVYTNGEVWKENSEFLERRMDLAEKGTFPEVEDFDKLGQTAHNRKACCGVKVKVADKD